MWRTSVFSASDSGVGLSEHSRGQLPVFKMNDEKFKELVRSHVALYDTLNPKYMDDHVYGVRLRLWTAATNEPVVHPPGDIWAWRIMVEWHRLGKLLIRPPELSGNPTRSHLVTMQEEMDEENNLALRIRPMFVHTSKRFLICRQILWHGVDGFTYHQKEGMLRIFIAFGQVWTREPWVQWQARLPLHQRVR
jgi:hypothetical protein